MPDQHELVRLEASLCMASFSSRPTLSLSPPHGVRDHARVGLECDLETTCVIGTEVCERK